MDNCRLKIGINSFDQAKEFLQDGDEFFLGFKGIRNGKIYALNADFNSLEEIFTVVSFLKKHNKKISLTLNNPFYHQEETHLICRMLPVFEQMGIDNIIVADVSLIFLIREIKTTLNIHLSTLCPVFNLNSLLFFKTLGVKRFILNSYFNSDEVKSMIQESGIETEMFLLPACYKNERNCIIRLGIFKDINKSVSLCTHCHNATNSFCKKEYSYEKKNVLEQLYDAYHLGVRIFKINTRNEQKGLLVMKKHIEEAKMYLYQLENNISKLDFLKLKKY